DGGGGAHQSRAAPGKASRVRHRPVRFDAHWSFTDQVTDELIDGRLDRVGPPFAARLPPADVTFVARQLEKTPPRGHIKALVSCYLHRSASLIWVNFPPDGAFPVARERGKPHAPKIRRQQKRC